MSFLALRCGPISVLSTLPDVINSSRLFSVKLYGWLFLSVLTTRGETRKEFWSGGLPVVISSKKFKISNCSLVQMWKS